MRKVIRFRFVQFDSREPITRRVYECVVDPMGFCGRYSIALLPEPTLRLGEIEMRPLRLRRIPGGDYLEFVERAKGSRGGWSKTPFFHPVQIVERECEHVHFY